MKDFDNILNDFDSAIKKPMDNLNEYEKNNAMDLYKDIQNRKSNGNQSKNDFANEIYVNIRKNSLLSEGKKEVKATKGKKKTKNKFLRNSILGIIMASVVAGTAVYYDFNNDGYLKRQKDLYDANNFMNTQIVYYLDEAGINYSKDDKIIINEFDKEKIIELYNNMEEDNFDFHKANYVFYKNLDFDSLDKVMETQGYDSFSNYLYQNFVEYDGSIKKGSEKVFENMVQEDFVNTVENIKNQMESQKGVNHGR